MTNETGKARGWQGWRRTAVLTSCLGAIGVVYLGSASTASAAFTLCKSSVSPKSKSNPGKAAKLSFTCDSNIRAYGVVSNKAIASYSSPPLVGGTPSKFIECEGAVPAAGFGCGIKDRNNPINCGVSNSNAPGLPAGPGGSPAAVNTIKDPPCTELIPGGSTVTQDVTLKSDPCTFKGKNALQMYLIVGGEPPISSFTARGDSTGVGVYASEPFRAKVKGYSGCEPAAAAKSKKRTAKPAAIGQDLFPIGCSGRAAPKDPAKPGIDLTYEFKCEQNIRGYTITSNKTLDFFGFESEVTLPTGEASGTESALIQCEGPVPGPGFGCGITNRQTSGNRLTAGNELRAELGLPTSPCKRKPGEAKLKLWLTVIGEPSIAGPPATTGEYISPPFPLPVSGYGKGDCPKPKAK